MDVISIKDFPGIRIGNAQNVDGGTGCTVILSEGGMCAGLDVRGGGPCFEGKRTSQAACQCTDDPRRTLWWRKCIRAGCRRRCHAVPGRKGHRF